MTNIEHLLSGKPVLNEEGDQVFLQEVSLAASFESPHSYYSLKELEDLTQYVNPLQARVDELEELLKAAELRLTTPVVTRSGPRKRHVHLTSAEVQEIEKIFSTHHESAEALKESVDLTIKVYDSSRTVIERILNGQHNHNTQAYKASIKKGTTSEDILASCIDNSARYYVCADCATEHRTKEPYKGVMTTHEAVCPICTETKPVGSSSKLFGHYRSA